jgi:hypothetical protein
MIERVRERARSSLKGSLVRTGAYMPGSLTSGLRRATDGLELGSWLADHRVWPSSLAHSRSEVFDLIANRVGDAKVLYLEFGVAEGASLRYWCNLLRNPESKLHGFDSFVGLPADWKPTHKRGHFSTGGQLPVFNDPRVTLFRGWFEETLPQYEPPPHDVLVVNLDADLYSSTVTALTAIRPILSPGSYIYFDEFDHPGDELRAFSDFIDETGFRFEADCATRDFVHLLFRRSG